MLQFIVDRGLIAYPFSSFTELVQIVARNLGPMEAVKLHSASDIYQCFKEGFDSLQSEARMHQVRKGWDNETERIWSRCKSMMLKSRSKENLFSKIEQELIRKERDFFGN